MTRPNVSRALAGLKDFQRNTVDHVFRRMYLDDDCVRRFLLADEVGLGKTLVTRGVVAKVVDRLWETTDRIDVLYICSNNDIARQNVNRLQLDEADEFTLATRITLLPVQIKTLRARRLNFVSFTPGTSFDLKSRTGIAEERVLLYRLLRDRWGFKGSAPIEVFRVDVRAPRFKRLVKEHNMVIDPDIEKAVGTALARDVEQAAIAGTLSLEQRYHDLVGQLVTTRGRVHQDQVVARRELVADLRALLAETCLEALEPDLIILDEFQRFKHLLAGDDDASRLARRLFDYSNATARARLLLVSATPYKMFTTADDAEGDDHYRDFLDTVGFLMEDPVRKAQCERALSDYRRALMRLPDDGEQPLHRAKAELETELRRVMVRTERLAATADRDGMLVEKSCEPLTLEADDALDFVHLERAAVALGEAGIIEYWKSAPYVLSFMEGYKLKHALTASVKGAEDTEGMVADVMREWPSLGLPWRTIIEEYGAVNMRNPRLRWLMGETVERGAWRLLWIPPSLPSYQPGGPFADPQLRGFTKRLIFSSWQIVPKAIAALVSYEAERCAIRSTDLDPSNTAEARAERRGLLRFARSDGRPTGMPSLLLFYPSFALAEIGDVRCGSPDWTNLTAEEWVEDCRLRVEQALGRLAPASDERGVEDDRWYWAAPILLDLAADATATRAWLSNVQLAHDWAGGKLGTGDETNDDDESTDLGWRAHVNEICKAVAPLDLGRMPHDLSRVLAEAAIAAPGVASLRALSRIAGGAQRLTDPHLRMSAAQLAWGFRSLFNLPETMALLRSQDASIPYWKLVLRYSVEGDLSAVLEEYAHVLVESLGLVVHNRFDAAGKIAAHARQVLGLRTSTLSVDEIIARKSDRRLTLEPHRMRTRFAMRFGEQSTDEVEAGRLEGGTVQKTRASQVRDAFNSPFWPFVLASTSVGQEGLDFHQYCHAIVHWNVPSNPVDIEQREGRVHRFKGHAIRKNVACQYGHAAVGLCGARELADPWEQVFQAAARDRELGASEMVPYWMSPGDGGAKIERYVPALALSRDRARHVTLLRSLALYRMVFGQNRQEDVLKYLMQSVEFERLTSLLDRVHIELSPPQSREPAEVYDASGTSMWEPRGRATRSRASGERLRRPPAGDERSRARSDPNAARQIFETVFPVETLRKLVQQQISVSIRLAHGVHPRGWGITLYAGFGALLRLNVGSIETLVIKGNRVGRLRLAVRMRALPKEIRKSLRSANGLRLDRSGAYVSEPEARLVDIDDEEIAEWLPVLGNAHLEMVRLASSRVRTQSTWAIHHSPGIIEYLREEGFEVPAPEYRERTTNAGR